MIRYLRLSNFRRHADTEITFDDPSQIILIAGNNGVGKSTIIEAITYSLYGEGRHGKANIDRLIRRGAELEGMEVEVEFKLADVVYRIKRRRDNGMSSAVLYGNDVALVEGSREVSSEITALLGMDARGFRLAVVAQQKELDGLASMRPAERAQMLSRLLRLDAITQARNKARDSFRSERDALRGIGPVESAQGLVEELEALATQIEGLQGARSEATDRVSECDRQIALLGDVEEKYLGASEQLTRLEAMATAAREEYERICGELSRLVVDDEVGELPDLGVLEKALGEVERLLAQAEVNATLARQAQMVEGELTGVEARIEEYTQTLSGPGEVANVDELRAFLEETNTELSQAAVARDDALVRKADMFREVSSLNERLSELEGIDVTCSSCGQEVSDEYRLSQISLVESQRREAEERLSACSTELRRCDEVIETAKAKRGELAAQIETAQHTLDSRSRIEGLMAEQMRRRNTYLEQLSRIVIKEFDIDSLLAQKGSLEVELVNARALHDAQKLRELAVAKMRDLREARARSLNRYGQADAAVQAAQLSQELLDAYERLGQLRSEREIEATVAAGIGTQIAVVRERIEGVGREKDRLVALRARRSELEVAAQVASECATVLDNVSVRLNLQIRPALEGAIGELLSRLSEGRFDAVALDEDYNLSVRDGGAMRSLGEFSGGEIDLIALAMRLALAGVVSERHGAGGAGFLILDECFGSQDHSRRESILNALRGLRGVYGQILLISHVGGLEDAADRVIDITLDQESGESCVVTK